MREPARLPGGHARGNPEGMHRTRYAVVGLGHIAQAAVLPAFANARRNSELAALVSGDAEKRKRLAKVYDVPAYTYDELDGLLARGAVDAIYIALPNNLHHPVTLKAAYHGVHVLCEKPMAMTEWECEEMIRGCEDAGVKLMIAYRLHFEETNLAAVELIRKGRIGEPRLFSSVFSYQVRKDNIRTRPELGGGPLYDIGIYCVNAARYLFRAEPVEVSAFGVGGREPRFEGVEEAVAATLRFPDERLGVLCTSFGAASCGSYRVVGTEGDLRVEPAFEYAMPNEMLVTAKGRSRRRRFAQRDQFAPEILYFSECIQRDVQPEPDGREGLADVRVLHALEQSMALGRPVILPPFSPPRRPTKDQEIHRPKVSEPELVHADAPTTES